ncbi:MAG: CCA tRNA nucleotidyltransferase [Thermoleophilaceae bacterium]
MSVTADLRERVRRLPGMERILPALEGLPPVFLVGGALRDLLRGEPAIDLDLAVEGDARSVARDLAARLSGQLREHGRFGTATIQAGDLAFDLATTRRERYERPGALPAVEPARLDEDLGRRDFSVNAMAAGLTGEDLGHLYDPQGGLDDLRAGLVRVLHERSFVDDPTRLLRAVRYAARLGFALDPETERLARAAVEQGALGTVSGGRIRDELLDLLAAPEASAGAERLRDLGIDRGLHPALEADPELVADAGMAAEAIGADRGLSGLAALCAGAPAELGAWLEELQLTAPQREAVARAAASGPALAQDLLRELRPSELHALLQGEPPEALALALAMRAPPEPVLRFVRELRDAALEIGGEDLIAAGVPKGPAVGRALDEVLRRKLDGELQGREQELQAALAAAWRDS